MQQLKPITQDMTEVELRQAIQMNFALILDAYTKGLNSIVFKGSTGASGSTGSRGASILTTTRDNLIAAQSAAEVDVDIANVYSSVDTGAMANAVTAMLQQGNANAAVNAMFKELSFVSKTTDLVEYDIVIVESGVVFQFQYKNDKWVAVPLNINLVTTYSITDDVANIVAKLVSARIDGMKQVPYYTRKLTDNDATQYLIPGDLTKDNPTGLDGQVSGDADLGPFIFAANEVQSGASGEGSTIFVGTQYECSKVFNQFKNKNNDELKGMPYFQSEHVGGMPRLIVPSVGYSDQQPAYKYGILFLDESATDFTDNASIQSLWSKSTANITFKNGALHFEAQPNANDTTDKRGCFIMSRSVFELWSKEGLIVHGPIKCNSIQFTDNAALIGVGTLGTDDYGNIVAKQGAVANPTPVGTIIMWPGTNMPAGQEDNWHLCDGALLKRNDYPTVFDIIGTTYNDADDPSDSFRLPNLQQRFPLGAKAGTLNNGKRSETLQETVNTELGQTGGESETFLNVNQLAQHSHSFAQHVHSMAHTHTIRHVHNGSGTMSSSGKHTHKTPQTIISNTGSHKHSVPGFYTGYGGKHSHIVYCDGANGGSKKGSDRVVSSGSESTTYYTSTVDNHRHSVSGHDTNDASHSHTIPVMSISESGEHTHDINITTGNIVTSLTDPTEPVSGQPSVANTDVSTTTPSSGVVGRHYRHANMPPYLAINFIIKVRS